MTDTDDTDLEGTEAPVAALPDFAQRAIFTVGPLIAAWLLLRIPAVGEIIPGNAEHDQEVLTTGAVYVLVWGGTYVWRWARSWLSRPPIPAALAAQAGRIDEWLALAAAGGLAGVADDVDPADFTDDTAAANSDESGPLYDTTEDHTP